MPLAGVPYVLLFWNQPRLLRLLNPPVKDSAFSGSRNGPVYLMELLARIVDGPPFEMLKESDIRMSSLPACGDSFRYALEELLLIACPRSSCLGVSLMSRPDLCSFVDSLRRRFCFT